MVDLDNGKLQIQLCSGSAANPAIAIEIESATLVIPRANSRAVSAMSSSREMLWKVLTYAAPPSSPSHNTRRNTAASPAPPPSVQFTACNPSTSAVPA